MSETSSRTSVLRVTSIILVIYGVIALVVGGLMMMGVYIAASDDMVGIAAGVAAILGIVAFFGGLLDLAVGLVGLRTAKHTEKTNLAFVLGIISVIFSVYGLVSAIGTGDGGSIASSLVGLILPGLYLYGVVKIRQGAA